MAEIDHLVKMANQIAANFSFHEDGVTRVADHLRRFWAPSMLRQLREHVAANGAGLDEAVLQAVQQFQEDQP